MKILHLTHTCIESDSRILKEMSCLVQAGYEVHGIGVGRELNARSKIKIDIKLHPTQIQARKLTFIPRILRLFIISIEMLLKVIPKAISLRPQVIHCHDTIALVFGVIASLFIDTKIVYDAHELESNKNSQSALLSKCTLFIEKLCWDRIDLLVSVSQSIISWYIENLGAKEYALVLNSPVLDLSNGKRNEDEKEYFRQRYNIADDKPIFIYVGVLGEGRGIKIILDTFSDQSLGAHVVFLGYGSLSSLIETYSKQYINIHLHPPVPHEHVLSLVQSADVGLCFVENISLSDYYCLPNKLFEYCFSGIPVLASDFPEINQVVEKYQLGLCCDVEPESILKAVRQAVSNPLPSVVSDMADLNWPAQVERLQQAYRSLVVAK